MQYWHRQLSVRSDCICKLPKIHRSLLVLFPYEFLGLTFDNSSEQCVSHPFPYPFTERYDWRVPQPPLRLINIVISRHAHIFHLPHRQIRLA